MTAKPLVVRGAATRDVEQAIDYYLREAGEAVALRFVDALDNAYRVISRTPSIGSPVYGYELNLPGLRHRRLNRYPFLVFYVELDDRIDVWRILHAQRDIPQWMQESDG